MTSSASSKTTPEVYELSPVSIKRERDEEDETTPLQEGVSVKRATTINKKQLVGFYETDLSTWVTRVKGKNAHGSPTILIWGAEGAPRLALYHKDEARNIFPFKLDLEPSNGGAIPSFLSGKPDPSKVSEGLDMQISLSDSQLTFLDKMDQWAVGQAVANSKDWFGRSYSEADISGMYTPCVKRDKDDKYPPKLKAKILLSGSIENFFTKVIFIKNDSSKTSGAGWTFVKPLLGVNQWRGNEVRAVIEIRSIWIVGKKFGLRITYTDLLIVEKSHGSADVDFPELDLD
jgi:hypothetical protein